MRSYCCAVLSEVLEHEAEIGSHIFVLFHISDQLVGVKDQTLLQINVMMVSYYLTDRMV